VHPLILFHESIPRELRLLERVMDFPDRFYVLISVLEREHGRLHKSCEAVDVSKDYPINKGLHINLHSHFAQLDTIYTIWKKETDAKRALSNMSIRPSRKGRQVRQPY
jgi:hypothetical protein